MKKVEMNDNVLNAVKAASKQLGYKFKPVWIVVDRRGRRLHRIIIENDRYAIVFYTDTMTNLVTIGRNVLVTEANDYESSRHYTTASKLSGKFTKMAEKFCEVLELHYLAETEVGA